MDENSTPRASQEETCLFHLIALKYAMAGDMESTELIQQLETRWYRIDWNDPAFIAFSDAMRNGPAHLVAHDEPMKVANLKALVHDQGDLLASLAESAKLTIARHKEAEKKLVPALNMATKVITYIADLMKLSLRLRDRLRVLGDDITDYKFPESPFPPIK